MKRRARRLWQGIAALIVTAVLILPARAQELTPEATDSATGLPASVSAEGFPQLGNPNAPVHMTEYCAFSDPACAGYYQSVFPTLLPRIASGDVLYTIALLVNEGDDPYASRAALCALEQGAFESVRQAVYADPSAGRPTPLASLVPDRSLWDACLSGTRPDDLLAAARRQAESTVIFDPDTLPYIVVNGVPALPDADSLNAAIEHELLEAASGDARPEATEIPVVTVEPLLGEEIPPPLDIALPAGWGSGYDVLLLADADGSLRGVPLAVYTGPVEGGQGVIVLLWGFPNLIPIGADLSGPVQDLWGDGLRLLRLAVIEQGCNIGTDLRTQYTVGGLPAMGTQFSAVDCPQLPDTRGWFAGVNQYGVNFVFFVYADPIDAMTGARAFLQSILDTVRFHAPESTPESTPEPAPETTATPAP